MIRALLVPVLLLCSLNASAVESAKAVSCSRFGKVKQYAYGMIGWQFPPAEVIIKPITALGEFYRTFDEYRQAAELTKSMLAQAEELKAKWDATSDPAQKQIYTAAFDAQYPLIKRLLKVGSQDEEKLKVMLVSDEVQAALKAADLSQIIVDLEGFAEARAYERLAVENIDYTKIETPVVCK